MKLLPFAALLAATVTAAKGHLKLDFEIPKNANAFAKRQPSAELPLARMPDYYQASLNIGSKNETVKVLLDTGSADLWIMDSSVNCIASDENDYSPACSKYGTFDPSASTTFKRMPDAPTFHTWLNDWSARSYYGIDSVSIGSVSVPQCPFGVVNETDSEYGVLGIGWPINEVGNWNASDVNNTKGTGFVYPNFPVLLKDAGLTHKNVYSLYLNSQDAVSGSILFGAVDHAKYYGTLQTVPLVNSHPEFFSVPMDFSIALDSVIVPRPDSSLVVDIPLIALLDPGTKFTKFPTFIMDAIGYSMDGTYNWTADYFEVSCDYMTNTDSLVFNFSGAVISVPFSDMVFAEGSTCFLALTSVDQDPLSDVHFATLGDNFLRHAYVV